VDPGSHLLTTDDQNRVLAGRGVGDGGVVENKRPMYASQYEFENGKRTNMLLLLLLLLLLWLLYTLSDTRTRADQKTPTCGGRWWCTGEEKVKSEKEIYERDRDANEINSPS